MPERLVIANTSPLLYLHLIGRIELFQTLYGTIVVPHAVRAELQFGIKAGFPAPDAEQLSWIHTKAVQSQALIPAIVDLGPGEAEVIALGLEHPGSLLVLDDLLARKVAALNHLTFTGTLGVLLKAKQGGHLKEIHPLIEALRVAGLWLSDDLVEAVLAQAGES
jgi:predicted nucleic acid-binding protein